MPKITAVFLLVTATIAAAQLAGRDVDLVAIDGVKLKATYYSADKPGPAILLLHMCGGTVSGRKTWDHLAPMLAHAGFHVLALDYRGYGESGDTPVAQAGADAAKTQHMKWPFDVEAAYEYLLDQRGVDRKHVGAVGASCGVDNAVALALRHPEVSSLVWLSGGPGSDGIEYVRRTPSLPIFAAASDDDNEFVPYMRWLIAFSTNPRSRFLEFEKAGHGTNMFAVEKGLAPEIVNWFEVTLPGSARRSNTHTARAKPTPQQRFWDSITSPGGAAQAAELFGTARLHPRAKLFPVWGMDTLAQERQDAGKLWDAIQFLNLNAAAHSDSPFVYYRLADAYRMVGNRELAVRNCQLALESLDKATSLPQRSRDYIRRNVNGILADLGAAAK